MCMSLWNIWFLKLRYVVTILTGLIGERLWLTNICSCEATLFIVSVLDYVMESDVLLKNQIMSFSSSFNRTLVNLTKWFCYLWRLKALLFPPFFHPSKQNAFLQASVSECVRLDSGAVRSTDTEHKDVQRDTDSKHVLFFFCSRLWIEVFEFCVPL